MDLGLPSYQDVQEIIGKGKSYVDDVARFAVKRPVKYAGKTIEPSDVKQRVLDLAVPPWGTPEQRQALQEVVEYGSRRKRPVIVRIVEMQ
jgi:hypothetical protein